jgi:DNA-binding transcriptional MerR regulator
MQKTFPEKMYYKIGEVAGFTELNTSVLRFWENEFEFLKPQKSSSGQRLYSRKDLELILEIKHLLYTERYTLDGVRQKYSSRAVSKADKINSTNCAQLLEEIKYDLQKIRLRM